jgi:isopentenyl-diphosphate Delta-isomerase
MPVDNPSETFVLVDEADRELGQVLRRQAHQDPANIHRAVTILIFNQNKTKLLFQQRSRQKDTSPGMWGCGVGGHVNFGDTYETAANRELAEELGLFKAKLTFHHKFLLDLGYEREFLAIFETSLPESTPLTPDPTEVDRVAWWERSRLAALFASHSICPDVSLILTKAGYLHPDFAGR